jgi:hypothetical protein
MNYGSKRKESHVHSFYLFMTRGSLGERISVTLLSGIVERDFEIAEQTVRYYRKHNG